ncbi:MAG: cytochrome c biogenesis protein CcsA [Deltaproteobacteria bacterium]|nr:cytochrome c biogenesis protein CcsA [Deltaproteobacteria bacterium]
MLVTGLFVATGVLYTVSCALYLTFMARGSEPIGRWAGRFLIGAAGFHLAFLGADWAVAGNLPIGDIHRTLSLASLLSVVVYLIAGTRLRIMVLGGFITPVTLLFLLGAALGRSVDHVPYEVRSVLLPVHISVNVLGVVAFTLAFAAAAAYLVQEGLLRRKKLGGLFQRLPALDVLDSLGFRLVTIGFPLLTIGIVTGALWAVRIDPSSPAFTATQALAILAWIVFAGVLLLRVAAGWRGRRAAIGTMVGYAFATAVLVGYMVNSGGAAAG